MTTRRKAQKDAARKAAGQQRDRDIAAARNAARKARRTKTTRTAAELKQQAHTKFKIDATIEELHLDDSSWRIIAYVDGDGTDGVVGHYYELYEAEMGYEEHGDAESGPLGVSRTIDGWKLIEQSMGRHSDICDIVARHLSERDGD